MKKSFPKGVRVEDQEEKDEERQDRVDANLFSGIADPDLWLF